MTSADGGCRRNCPDLWPTRVAPTGGWPPHCPKDKRLNGGISSSCTSSCPCFVQNCASNESKWPIGGCKTRTRRRPWLHLACAPLPSLDLMESSTYLVNGVMHLHLGYWTQHKNGALPVVDPFEASRCQICAWCSRRFLFRFQEFFSDKRGERRSKSGGGPRLNRRRCMWTSHLTEARREKVGASGAAFGDSVIFCLVAALVTAGQTALVDGRARGRADVSLGPTGASSTA